MILIKPSGLLKTVPFPSLMTISTSFPVFWGFLLSSRLLQRFGQRSLFLLIQVALSDVSYCIAIVRQGLEYIFD